MLTRGCVIGIDAYDVLAYTRRPMTEIEADPLIRGFNIIRHAGLPASTFVSSKSDEPKTVVVTFVMGSQNKRAFCAHIGMRFRNHGTGNRKTVNGIREQGTGNPEQRTRNRK